MHWVYHHLPTNRINCFLLNLQQTSLILSLNFNQITLNTIFTVKLSQRKMWRAGFETLTSGWTLSPDSWCRDTLESQLQAQNQSSAEISAQVRVIEQPEFGLKLNLKIISESVLSGDSSNHQDYKTLMSLVCRALFWAQRQKFYNLGT